MSVEQPPAVRIVAPVLAALADGGSLTITDAMLVVAPRLAEVQRGFDDLTRAYPEYVWSRYQSISATGRATTIAWSRPRSTPTRQE